MSQKTVRSKDPEMRLEYIKVRNQVKNMVNKLKKKYEKGLSQKAKENPKAICSYIKSKSKTREGIGDLHVDPEDIKSIKTEDNKEKANILSEYFSSVFTKEPEGDVPVPNDIMVKQDMPAITVTENMVFKFLQTLKTDKSPGPDSLHPRLLKELSASIVNPLCTIFNQSLNNRKVPKLWKNALISAIFKKGNKSQAKNYRPVSLTSIVCKIMEKIIREHIIEHMKVNGLFAKKSYGFISGRSTTLQLLEVIDKWTEALDRGYDVDCIYTNFQKAFDKVPHRRLIRKVENYGITNTIIGWIQDFLTGRYQIVAVNGENSNWEEVTSGMPQVSVLGPLLFVLYITDLPDHVDSDAYPFADDTKIFKIITGENDHNILQDDLQKMEERSNTWLLKFHPEKCKYMNITRITNEGKREYQHLDQNINEEKDIGVTIDSLLSFGKHICEKVIKANSVFAAIRKTFKYLNAETFLPIYKTLVRTHLEYANAVWAPYKKKHIDKIESVQKRATKQIPGLGHLSYPERLKIIKLPTLAYRRIRGDMIEAYKILHMKYDPEASSFLKKTSDSKIRSSTRINSNTIMHQRFNTEVRKKFIFI